MQKINIETEWTDCSNEEKFFILTCVDGCGTIEGLGNVRSMKLLKVMEQMGRKLKM